MNTLYFGDNLEIIAKHIADESVDLITLEPPTQAMKNEAATAGYYQPPYGIGKRVESIQIRTIEELLVGQNFDFPLYGANVSFKEAERLQKESGQGELEL